MKLKHLAPYLPYRLKILRPDNKTTLTLKGINGNLLILDEDNIEKYGHIKKNKPVLRPLSDLLKTIKINNQKFMPARKLGFYQADVDFVFNNQTDLIQFRFVQKLIEWHFDVFGLIDAGLAVDINSL